MPTLITRGSASSVFAYDEGNERYFEKHVEAGKITRIWKLGKLFEYSETTEAGVTTQEEKHYLTAVAQLSYKPAQHGRVACSQWRYFHGDRLGSIETVTNATGQVFERHGFDPFGKPRQANWMLDSTRDGMPASQKGLFSRVSTRGFTGHDHIDSVGLIHMNGRAYDPELGRFLSVDPFMQAPLNAQSLNAYSYVMNNPLAGTDPTGYASETKECDTACKKHEKEQRQINRNTRRGGVTASGSAFVQKSSGAPPAGTGTKTEDVSDPVKIAALMSKVKDGKAVAVKDDKRVYVQELTGGTGVLDRLGGIAKSIFDSMSHVKFDVDTLEGSLCANNGSGCLDTSDGFNQDDANAVAGAINTAALFTPLGAEQKIATVVTETEQVALRVAITAEGAADAALAAGKTSGAAAELKIGNLTFTGVSGEVVPHNPQITGALMGTSNAQRKVWHGGCAEIVCLEKALNAGVDPAGGVMRAVNIGTSGSGHNTPKIICTSCTDILKYFGVGK